MTNDHVDTNDAVGSVDTSATDADDGVTSAADRDDPPVFGRFDRRTLLKIGVGGGIAALGLGAGLRRGGGAAAAEPTYVGLAATDGWISLPMGPGGVTPRPPIWPDELAEDFPDRNLYTFGFRDVTVLDRDFSKIIQLKNKVQHTAPPLYRGRVGPTWRDFRVNDRILIELWNLGFLMRPDLADGHTVHWHGFPNQIPYYDGVPETSISVPVGRSFTYEFIPNEPGTYMYHCHFEDVEHVQMGMTGVVFVRPLDYDPGTPALKTAYGAGTGTEFAREHTWMITEIDLEEHWLSSHIQQPDWSEFRPSVFMINGRTFPDTLVPSADNTDTPLAPPAPGGVARLTYQPTGALVQGNQGERVLIRLANLGFRSHALELSGLPMQIVGIDAKPLHAGRLAYAAGHALNGSFDTGPRAGRAYETNVIDVPPGRSVDVIVDLAGVAPGVYPIAARGVTGSGDPSGGGSMRSEIRVHPAGTLPPQTAPNF